MGTLKSKRKSRSRTKSEIEDSIKHVRVDMERHKANICEEILYLKSSETRIKTLERERDMAWN